MTTFRKGQDGIEVTDGAGFTMTDMDRWPRYTKKVSTAAMRIVGSFSVETSEGKLTCDDGYLCIDARGYPYPVSKDEFDLIYEPVS